MPEVGLDVDVAWPYAWAALARFEHWPSWGPSVTAVEPPVGEVAVGRDGRVRTVVGGWVPYTVTEVEPGRRWTWRVGGLPATGHRVEPRGPDRCRLVFEVPWWASPYLVVCRVALPRVAAVARTLHDA